MIKLQTKIKPLIVAISSAILFATLSAGADVTAFDTGAIKVDYPVEQSMAQWLIDKDEYALNPVNIRAGKHPDRSDPNGGPYDVVYIFPDEATAQNWWPDGVGTPPDGIPDDAVAFIHWELDNGSGAFPGVMAKTDVNVDVDNFKSRNCIMAAGATIPKKGFPEGIEKNCNNDQGTSKRFKMNVLKADVPIDLVYNIDLEDLVFENLLDPETGLEELPTYDGTTEAGRIYRILQKWHNATAMDPALGDPRPGVRVVGYRLELGYGVGEDVDPTSTLPTFSPIANSNGTGLLPNKTIGFELRPCMQDAFFDVSRGQPGEPKNACAGFTDSTGQKLPQEIWLEEEYGTFSPKMYSFTDDKRMLGIGIPGGFWDKRPAGIYPPEIQTLGVLDSGDAFSDSLAYWDNRLDGATNIGPDGDNTGPRYVGATTPNYFDMKHSQAADATDVININEPSPFGYLMYYGVLSDETYGPYGDFGNLAQAIYLDDDGDPASEGATLAWWDGDEFRWSVDGAVFDGVVTPDEKFAVVDEKLLKEWALYPLREEADFDLYPDGGFPPGPLYEIGVTDDLGGLNIDYWVYLGKDLSTDPVIGDKTSFTIRLTAISTDGVVPPIAENAVGNMTPAWVTNPAPALATLIDADGVINITEPAYAGEPLNIVLGDDDADALGTPTVVLKNDATGETEDITLLKDEDLAWRFTASLPTDIVVSAGTNNDGRLNVWKNQTVTVTYVDLFIGGDANDPANSNVTKTDSVVILGPDDDGDDTSSPSDDSSGCSCSTSPDGSVDPILPAAVLFALGYLGLRRRENSSR